MICKKCSQEIDDKAKFCPNCGEPQNVTAEEPTPESAPAPESTPTPESTPAPETLHTAAPDQVYTYAQEPVQDSVYTANQNTAQNTPYTANQGYPGGNNMYQAPEPQINTTLYMVLSILTTICCCLPLGIVSIVFATKINSAQKVGMMDEARNCAKKAKMFMIIGVIVGAIVNTIYFVTVVGSWGYYY